MLIIKPSKYKSISPPQIDFIKIKFIGGEMEHIMPENNEALDFTPDIYTLTDEEGNEQQFEILDAMEVDDIQYFALVPYFEDSQEMLDDDGELVILKSTMVDGEEMLASIDDDDEFERIGAIFLSRLEEMFEFGESEDDDITLQ